MSAIDKLTIAKVASCECQTKTNDPAFHGENCRYRILCEVEAELSQAKQVNEHLWKKIGAGISYEERLVVEKLQAELAQLRAITEGQWSELRQHRLGFDALKAERDRLQLERDAAKSAKVSLQQQLDEARTDLGEAINRHNALADSLAKVRAEVERLCKWHPAEALHQETTRLLSKSETALTQSEKAREGLEGLVADCGGYIKRVADHLDGCSHGYPDELWDDATTLLARIEGK